MGTRLLFICLLASAFAVSVKGKPHERHQASVKSSHTATEKDAVSEGANKGKVLPTNVEEEEDEELSSQDNANTDKEEEEREEGDEEGKRSTPVLLSQEELVDLLQKESREEVAAEDVGEEEGKVEIESAGTVEEVTAKKEEEVGGEVEVEGELEGEVEGEVEEEVEEEVEGEVEKEWEDEEGVSVKEVEVEVKGEEEEETDNNAQEEDSEEEEEDSEEEEEAADKQTEEEEESLAVDGEGEQGADVKEIGSSTESEIPNDMDYTMPLETQTAEGKPLTDDTQLLLEEKKLDEVKTSEQKEEETATEGEIPTSIDDYESQQDVQNTEALEDEEVSDEEKLPEGNKNQGKDSQAVPQENSSTREEDDPEVDQDSKNSVELDGSREEDKEKESISHTKGKIRKMKKNLRVRKHPAQRDEASQDVQRDEASQDGQRDEAHAGQASQDSQKSEGQAEHSLPADNAVYKPQRKRAGKWASVGMNPVQVRARVDLYPRTRPSLWASIHRGEASSDPCDTFHCKRGKTCKLGEDNKPTCVCQQPSACPHSKSEVDHVCGSDNTTYDTSCDLFATKCTLEGTRKGHRLHLDYTGPCKIIAPCLSSELVQFPLRMRDWLKNVLLQLYEHDSKTPGFLTSKQRFRVRKIFESERRLHAGDHPIELLAQDFEKNYNMYIYPVHWQFAQMDQHPADRLLSHTELAPLRVPLVPMEHCTSLFFQECDVDKDKQVSFREWAHCFGIRNEDMDVNLLF